MLMLLLLLPLIFFSFNSTQKREEDARIKSFSPSFVRERRRWRAQTNERTERDDSNLQQQQQRRQSIDDEICDYERK
jgi:hypothetical protein